ncbi:hypothetical protein UT300003_32140 [Clostridium sardiniense]
MQKEKLETLYNQINSRAVAKKRVTKKDIALYLECVKKCDFEPMKSTRLYNNNSVAYCVLQEIHHNLYR